MRPTGEVLRLYAATIFLGALLLFLVQPMFARSVLPLLGGAPAVWNTALVFFQGALLAGYLYVYALDRWLRPGRQVVVHLALLAAAFVSLPIRPASGWAPPASAVPTWWLLGLLSASVGLPFFAVSATSPLLQRWFSHTRHPQAEDPYFLYSASNLGSMLALLAYPVLVEPLLGLRSQGVGWTWGYALLMLLIAATAAVSLRRWSADGPSTRDEAHGGEQREEVPSTIGPGPWRRLHWILLAFAPSSLLLGVTHHLSTDVAAAPLLWVVPLALYLLTFVFAFARTPLIPGAWIVRAQAVTVVVLALLFRQLDTSGFVISLGLHLVVFFLTALVCHSGLAARRPPTLHLTEYYLWISVGGVLGGAFTALLAPVVFESVLEYPLVIALACALRPWPATRPSVDKADLLIPVALGVALLVAVRGFGLWLPNLAPWIILTVLSALGLAVFSLRNRPLGFGLGVGVLLVFSSLNVPARHLEARNRSFFGVHRVWTDPSGEFHLLQHGSTTHGAQSLSADMSREPIGYFSRISPVGQVMAARSKRGSPGRTGVIGLGAGTLACYAQPGEDWTFFEIDPVVVALARDRRLFTYLSQCAPDARIVLGDGRLSIGREPEASFDMLVLDAFSSDAIPVHLLTREAVELYLSRLKSDGVMLFHISNRYLELAPVLADVAGDLGLAARIQRHSVPDSMKRAHVFPSVWVAVAANGKALASVTDARWQDLPPDRRRRRWTDDYSNIVRVIRWSP